MPTTLDRPLTLEEIVAAARDGNTIPYIETFLSVKSKTAGIVPFRIKPAQRTYLERKRLRNIVLKARQMGISTVILADFYVRTIIRPATMTLLVAQKKDQAKVFLETIKMFYELTPAALRPVVENDNIYEFSFPLLRSKILVASPTKDVGRGLTIHNLLCSELAFWKYAEESMTGLEEAVPEDDGIIVVESTPNGTGNTYHRMWEHALDPEDESYNGYTAIELPASLEYSDAWLAQKRKKLSARKYAQEYGLSFLQSGLPVFEEVDVDRHRARIKSGELLPRDPLPGHHHLIGVDPSEGIAEGDRSVIVVFDRDTGEEVHCEAGRWRVDTTARRVDALARKYKGIVGVERNNHGHAVLLKCRDLGTPGIYRHDDGRDGWVTSGKTKPVMIDELEEAIRNDYVKIGDLTACDEFRDYQNIGKSTAAPSGRHDDHVMARAVAWQMRKRNSRPLFLTD